MEGGYIAWKLETIHAENKDDNTAVIFLNIPKEATNNSSKSMGKPTAAALFRHSDDEALNP